MLRVMVIIGTRPEAIKMALVVKFIETLPDMLKPIVCDRPTSGNARSGIGNFRHSPGL